MQITHTLCGGRDLTPADRIHIRRLEESGMDGQKERNQICSGKQKLKLCAELIKAARRASQLAATERPLVPHFGQSS